MFIDTPLGRGRGARREGPLQEGARRRAQELHRHRQPLRGARTSRRSASTRPRMTPEEAADIIVECVAELIPTLTDAELAADTGRAGRQAPAEVRDSRCSSKARRTGQGGRRTPPTRYLVDAICEQTARRRPAVRRKQVRPHDRLRKSRVWIVDPLDGTREYGEGRDGLGGPCRARDRRRRRDRRGGAARARPGAALRPGSGRCRRHPAARAWWSVAHGPPPRRSRWPKRSTRNWSRWARQAPRRWQSSAARPTSISTRAGSTNGTTARRSRSRWRYGLHCSRIDGSPLVYNQTDAYLPDLLICRARVGRAGAWRKWLSSKSSPPKAHYRRSRRCGCGSRRPAPSRKSCHRRSCRCWRRRGSRPSRRRPGRR